MKVFAEFKPKWFVVFFLVMMSVPLFLRDQYVLQVLIMVLYFAYLASCWNIVGGFAGLFSLGHASFIGLGLMAQLFCFFNIT